MEVNQVGLDSHGGEGHQTPPLMGAVPQSLSIPRLVLQDLWDHLRAY